MSASEAMQIIRSAIGPALDETRYRLIGMQSGAIEKYTDGVRKRTVRVIIEMEDDPIFGRQAAYEPQDEGNSSD